MTAEPLRTLSNCNLIIDSIGKNWTIIKDKQFYKLSTNTGEYYFCSIYDLYTTLLLVENEIQF